MYKLDYTNVRQEVIGTEHGIDLDFTFSNYSQKITNILKEIKTKRDNAYPNYHWLNFGDDENIVKEVLEYADMVRGKFEDILIVGNGTTVFGVESALKSLLKPFWNTREKDQRDNFPRIHFLKYIDPDTINEFPKIKDMKKCLFIIASKDCANPSVMSLFMIAKRRLEYEIGENYRMHMLIITVHGSVLEQIAYQEAYKCFVVQEKLGFNFYSQVSLVPMALTGLSIEEFISGIHDTIENTLNNRLVENNTAQVALLHHYLRTQRNKYITVIIPYAERLLLLPKWFSYLVEETLTRDMTNDNQYAPHGQICYNSQGSGDQRSLLQMMAEGPNDKQITIINVEKFNSDNAIPEYFQYTSIGYLGGKTLSELTNAEMEALKMVLVDKQRPNITLTLPEINPYEIGSIMSSMTLGVLIKSYLYNIDPFHIPQLEQMYDYICAQLGRYGYEHTLESMRAKKAMFTALPALLE